MNVIKTELEGVVIIEPKVFKDERGYFFESFNQKEFNEKVQHIEFVQDNESLSSHNVLRGLHWQIGEFAQSKLVRVAKGSVYDVAVDIRVGSPTFGKYVVVGLSEFNHRQLFIPRGFAHGFITIKDDTIFQYKCDNFYNKESECAIRWNDPDINIDWESYVNLNQIILSDKDKQNKFLKDLTINNLFDYNKNYYE